MKKIVSILMILCMLLAAASVLAEGNEVPTLESMPNVKAYEGLEEPDIALFNGTWEPTDIRWASLGISALRIATAVSAACLPTAR